MTSDSCDHYPGLATSRSVSTTVREVGDSDHGFLWALNSYWRYRQQGDDVLVEVLSVSLSRDVPSLVQAACGAGDRSCRQGIDAAYAGRGGEVRKRAANGTVRL